MSTGFRVMGIVNVTPDSFSDGGLYVDPVAAVEHALRLAREGADILDVGGESTRPGAQPVLLDEERARVEPVVAELAARTTAQISIDTSKALVARAAIAAGASIVNDVTALRADPQTAAVVADAGVELCLVHMLGEPRTMQREPRYDDVVDAVRAFLEERLAFAVHEGVSERRVMLDPGIGFGKTIEHNLELIRRLDELLMLGCPIVIGTSRKSFLGTIAGHARGVETVPAGERLAGTIASNVLAFQRGASVFRVHDVAPARDALAVAAATLGWRWRTRIPGGTPTS
jgi:dihydropteroate synthase